MKKINFFTFSIIMLAIISGCNSDDDQPVISSNPAASQIITPEANASFVITDVNLTDSIHFEWTAANYGVPTQVDYELQLIPVGGTFENPIILGATTDESIGILVESLNLTLLGIPGTIPNQSRDYWVRVKSALYGGIQEIYSEEISYSITSFAVVISVTDRLWVPGDYQAFLPASAPAIHAIGENLYEGYIYVNQAGGIKFTSAPDWDHTNYGYAGPGLLSTNGAEANIPISAPGYYRFFVNTAELTYEITLIQTWGLIGTATTGVWDVSTPMDYNISTGLWSKTVDLANGALKFRANDEWSINFGPESVNSLVGQLIQTDASISIPAAGNYTIVIDLSKSVAPFEYTYSVTLN